MEREPRMLTFICIPSEDANPIQNACCFNTRIWPFLNWWIVEQFWLGRGLVGKKGDFKIHIFMYILFK